MSEIEHSDCTWTGLGLGTWECLVRESNKKWDCEEERSVVLVSCGLWVQVQEKLNPSVLLSVAAIGALDQALQNDIGFRTEAAASSKEPPVNMAQQWRFGRVVDAVDDSCQRVVPIQAGGSCSCWRKWRKPSFKRKQRNLYPGHQGLPSPVVTCHLV